MQVPIHTQWLKRQASVSTVMYAVIDIHIKASSFKGTYWSKPAMHTLQSEQCAPSTGWNTCTQYRKGMRSQLSGVLVTSHHRFSLLPLLYTPGIDRTTEIVAFGRLPCRGLLVEMVVT
jgi:hypothetical protein